jgi:hypothetical protein
MSKHPSKQRQRVAAMQRVRRAGMTRIDYMPSHAALAIMEAKRAHAYPGSVDATHSAVLDAILSEWARLTGTGYGQSEPPASLHAGPELSGQSAHTKDSGFCQPKRARARANNYGAPIAPGRFAGAGAKDSGPIKQGSAIRVPCGARRRRDGQPCQALSVPGKRRCKWHGGSSTGPRTLDGATRSRANLRQFKVIKDH